MRYITTIATAVSDGQHIARQHQQITKVNSSKLVDLTPDSLFNNRP
jgi:hypothetical protein